MTRKGEMMIFVRGRWEIATVEINQVDGHSQWIRRDQSYICDVGDEIEKRPLPPKPNVRNTK